MNANKSVTAHFIEDGGSTPGESVWDENVSGAYYMGNVGVGTTNLSATLTVNGDIHAEEIKVMQDVPAADFVFDEYYEIPTLKELEDYIKEHKHLPGIPSAGEFEKDGYKVGEMDAILLQKIEEMTLYIIELNKQIEILQQENTELKKQCE